MIPPLTTLTHALLLCIPFTLFAVGVFWWRPRLWLHSLPPDIQRMAGPKTVAEENMTKCMLPVMLLILPGLSTVSALNAQPATGSHLTILGVVLHLGLVWFLVHAWDLLVIDAAHMKLIDPNKPPIAGTQGAAGWRDFGFHTRAFVKACVMSLLFVLPMSLIVSWVRGAPP